MPILHTQLRLHHWLNPWSTSSSSDSINNKFSLLIRISDVLINKENKLTKLGKNVFANKKKGKIKGLDSDKRLIRFQTSQKYQESNKIYLTFMKISGTDSIKLNYKNPYLRIKTWNPYRFSLFFWFFLILWSL